MVTSSCRVVVSIILVGKEVYIYNSSWSNITPTNNNNCYYDADNKDTTTTKVTTNENDNKYN